MRSFGRLGRLAVTFLREDLVLQGVDMAISCRGLRLSMRKDRICAGRLQYSPRMFCAVRICAEERVGRDIVIKVYEFRSRLPHTTVSLVHVHCFPPL